MSEKENCCANQEEYDDDNVKYVLTEWGCLSSTLDDYNIHYSHITPVMGKHMVQDFLDALERSGYIEKVEKDE